MDKDNSKLEKDLNTTTSNYEFAQLSSAEVAEIDQIQNKLCQNQHKEIILLAYEKK